VKAWLRSTIFYFLGVLISTLCAIVLAKLYTGTGWKIGGPLLFAITLVILSSHFGASISVASALLGAAMFSFFLYNPENSFQVSSETDRSTLAWMILISVSLSYLLYPTRKVGALPDSRELQGRTNSDLPQIGKDLANHQEIGRSPALANRGELGAPGFEVGNSRAGGEER
jgi:K+-sensing histidine kinase KdpD